MTLLFDYLLFFAKVFTIIFAIMIIVLFIVGQRKKSSASAGSLTIKDISEEYDELKNVMLTSNMSEVEIKQYQKEQKREKKQQKKQAKKTENKKAQTDDPKSTKKPNSYLISFNGSVDAHEVEDLRQEVTAILSIIKPEDEVILKLESPGGVVHGYGLAASQLMRFRTRNIPLTAVIDKVAASGGYMMACTANKIVAAPFAIVGSIGVVAQIPNFHRLLKKNDIDIELQTAGEYKRTLTMLGENTEEGRKKFKQELEETHLLFKDFVKENRPNLNIEDVATGEHWFATQAIEKGLVDEISTSDDFILSRLETHKVIEIKYQRRKKLTDRLTKKVLSSIEQLFFRNSRTL
ncbi:protease SohB [Orbaceae bacterium ac157xtp]